MPIDSLQFLQATNPSAISKPQGSVQYNPNTYSGVSEGNSGYNPYYSATTEDLELANAIAEGNYNTGLQGVSSPRTTSPSQGLQGAGFEGFTIPENNGTGELICDVSGREDSIEDCPWEAYYA